MITTKANPMEAITGAIVAHDLEAANVAYHTLEATVDTAEIQARGIRASEVLNLAVTGATGRPKTLDEMIAYVNG